MYTQGTNHPFLFLTLSLLSYIMLVAKKYKYRTRDEGMFRQHDVEVYDRYTAQAAASYKHFP